MRFRCSARTCRADEQSNISRKGGGLTNLVFCVEARASEFIVQVGAKAEKINAFWKEQWAIAKAREAGVPAPEVLEVGNEAAPLPYMILRMSPGTEATFHPRRKQIIGQMGRYACVINSIETTGFGSTFDWSHNQLSRNATWSDFLKCELKMEDRLETLDGCGMLDNARVGKLRAALENVAVPERLPHLNHGDMRPKNVLADDQGTITCILDWAVLAPYFR